MHALFLHDKNQHGTLTFPAEYHFVDSKHPRYQMPFHWHKEWEIMRILSGTFHLHLDSESYTAQPGDVLLIRGGVLHGGMPEDCRYECFVFDLHGLFRTMDSVKDSLRPIYRQERLPQNYFPAAEPLPIHNICDELMAAFGESTPPICPELETIGCICRLFGWLLKENRFTDTPQANYSDNHRMAQIKSVLEYIEAHYKNSLTLEQLSQVAGMNAKYFCRVFRAITHQSPMDYVNFYRTEQAAYLLDSTDMPITNVGLDCGFEESSYFTKVFKKYKRLTPRQYRKNIRI